MLTLIDASAFNSTTRTKSVKPDIVSLTVDLYSKFSVPYLG